MQRGNQIKKKIIYIVVINLMEKNTWNTLSEQLA